MTFKKKLVKLPADPAGYYVDVDVNVYVFGAWLTQRRNGIETQQN